MRRLVQPPFLVGIAEAARDLEAEVALSLRIELARQERVLDLAGVCDLLDQRDEVFLELVEDLSDLRRLHVRLVVVEQHVVRLVRRIEAGDVSLSKLDVLFEIRTKRLEVGSFLRRPPCRERERTYTPHLPDEVGWNTARLLEIMARHADEARLEGVVLGALLDPAQILEQLFDLGRDEALLRQSADRRDGLGASLRASGRHHHALVPEEQHRRSVEVGDLGKAFLQSLEGRLCHGANFVRRRRTRARGKESSRPPVSPAGLRIRTSAIKAPTTTIRVPAGRSNVRPSTCTPFSASARNESTPLTAAAPTTAPHRLVT